MSDDKPPDKPPDEPPRNDQSSALEKGEEAKLEAVLGQVPPEQFPTIIREMMVGIFDRTSGPRLDPEVIKIAAATVEKDQENKFKYLTQKEENAAEKSRRDDDLRLLRHKDGFKIVRPAMFICLLVFAVSLFVGIYLAANGHETLGSCILTCFISFVGGLGSADLIKRMFKLQ